MNYANMRVNHITIQMLNSSILFCENNFTLNTLTNKQMENSNSAMKQASSFILGAVVGGVLGILFAPNKGSETRRKIANSTDNLKDSVKDQYSNLVYIVQNEMLEIKEKANEVLDNQIAKVEKAAKNLSA